MFFLRLFSQNNKILEIFDNTCKYFFIIFYCFKLFGSINHNRAYWAMLLLGKMQEGKITVSGGLTNS